MRILSISSRYANLRANLANKFTLPDRLKGTIVEKWANYWRNLLRDYADVAVGLGREIRDKPRKVALIGGGFYALYACYVRNPDEDAFINSVRKWNNLIVLVPSDQQNPISAEYLCSIEKALNDQKLRLLSFGFLSLIWFDLFDKDDCTYPAICDYTRVTFWNFHKQIVDVGFWNHFLRLEWKMQNFDINYL